MAVIVAVLSVTRERPPPPEMVTPLFDGEMLILIGERDGGCGGGGHLFS
jgi:hypothetical protein